MPNHFSEPPFQPRGPSTAAFVAFTTASAAPAPSPSFKYHGIRSRWLCPPTSLHKRKNRDDSDQELRHIGKT